MADRESYPAFPGFRDGPNRETSEQAAMVAAKSAKTMLLDIEDYLGRRPRTPEELVSDFAADGRRVLLTSVRARCTQGFRAGKFKPSGTFGKGESGRCRVIRWAIATPEERALHAAREAVRQEKEADQ